MDNKDVTAKWAREKALMQLGVKAQKQLDFCLMRVKGAVEQNLLTVNINQDEQLEDLTKKELEKRGFKVECHSHQREGTWTTITW